MTSVVLDTNVVVSANMSGEGHPAFIVSLVLSGRLRFYVSEPILREYERVLLYPRLKFLPHQNSIAEKAAIAKVRLPSNSPTLGGAFSF